MENLSKKFILEFFKDSEIVDENGVLTVSQVPQDFERFVGKSAPYRFVFDFDLHTQVKNSELIMQGSYFLLAIRDYLSDKGQTSLLKINIALENIEKNQKLKNFKILSIDQTGFDFFSEFYFLSTYQYLNEKKQSTNNILVKDKEILNLDLEKFKIQNGHKDEVPSIDLTKSYQIAQVFLKNSEKSQTNPIKLRLKEKLDRELSRVRSHYFKQIKEKDEELDRCVKKIKLFASKLKHTYYHRDIDTINRQIRESKAYLENLKKKDYRERLKTEEKFHLVDETEKHVLSIKNNLINITVFYYPIYTLQVSSKGKTFFKRYDPILDKTI